MYKKTFHFNCFTQGKEPNHLLSIFGKPLLITSGGYSREAGKETGVSKIALYQVRVRFTDALLPFIYLSSLINHCSLLLSVRNSH